MKRGAGVTLALAVGLLCCAPEVPAGDPPPSGPGPTTRLDGVLGGDGARLTGTLRIDLAADLRALAAEGEVQALATVMIVGADPIRVPGMLDVATKVVTISGEGFSLTGTLDGDEVLGTFSWVAHEGGMAVDGVFATLSEELTPTLYCGSYDGAGGEEGVWNLLAGDGGLMRGVVSSVWGFSAVIRGSSIDGTVVLAFEGGTGQGTIQPDLVRGTWSVPTPDRTFEGTFEGTSSDCPPLP